MFDVQDKRHQKFLLEEKQTSDKKIKTESKVSFAELEFDSDEEESILVTAHRRGRAWAPRAQAVPHFVRG